jgi:peroxiredoxin
MTGLLFIGLIVLKRDYQYPQYSPCVHGQSREILRPMINLALIIILVVLAAFAFVYWRFRIGGRSIPDVIRRGQPLPDFQAIDESGDPVRSTELHGTAVVMLFVRGNWCPFCSTQVRNLSAHYKSIIDLGARLILVTPKPLETTRRVAEFFEVEFDFWLDADLAVARQLGLLQLAGVPDEHRKEYGDDTVWPTSLVIDPNGVIRYTELSKVLIDRPNPEKLLRELRNTLAR